MLTTPIQIASIRSVATFDAHVIEAEHGRCLTVEHQGSAYPVDIHPDDLPPVNLGDRVLVTVLNDSTMALDRVLHDSHHRYSAQITLEGTTASLSLPEGVETLELKLHGSLVKISKAGVFVNGETLSLDAGDDLRLFGSRILNN